MNPMEMWGSLIYLQSGVVMSRRDVFLEFGGSYERHWTYLEDQYLWLQILLNHKIYRDATPLLWYHTEDSDLEGPNRMSPEPLWPFLADPEPVRKNCPADYRLTLEKFLSYAALLNFDRMVSRGDMPAARYLLQHSPVMKVSPKYWGLWFIRLRIKVAWPWLIPYVRAVKQFILQS
jgi:hypothetical protein